jgi:hypothetical protein
MASDPAGRPERGEMPIQRRLPRLGVAAMTAVAVGVLTVSMTLVGLGSVGAQHARSIHRLHHATATATIGAAAVAGPLDHFLCYPARQRSPSVVPGVGFKIPKFLLLDNRLVNPVYAGFLTGTYQFNLHCNPVQKTVTTAAGGTVVTPIQNPSYHLACVGLNPQADPSSVPTPATITLQNQFGIGELNLKPPRLLCLPTLKDVERVAGPPTFNPPGPNEVSPDHMTCYPASYPVTAAAPPPRFTPPKSVGLHDQFTAGLPAPFTARVGLPVEVCAPTQKIVDPGAIAGSIQNPAELLVCFVVVGSVLVPIPALVFDFNQFGVGQMTIVQPTLLCVPSNLVP